MYNTFNPTTYILYKLFFKSYNQSIAFYVSYLFSFMFVVSIVVSPTKTIRDNSSEKCIYHHIEIEKTRYLHLYPTFSLESEALQ